MKAKTICGVMLICLFSALVSAQTVYADYNHHVDFTKFKTYA